MGRVVIAKSDEVTPKEFPRLTGVTAQGAIRTRDVIAQSDRPLLLWMHELAPGAEIRWEAPPVGHLAYVWEGGVEAGGRALSRDSTMIVEHKGSGGLRAGTSGATIAHFHPSEDRGKKADQIRRKRTRRRPQWDLQD